uniref:Uncharacterized protein n=1 Tax=viral metagenome TaxID=1070528 RepID=A0A6M3MCY0_9ZZZZ
MGHRSHTKHRPTKEKFYPATHVAVGDVSTRGSFSGPDIDATTEAGYVNCYIPKDFDSLEEIVLVFIAGATATPMYVRILTDYAKAGEAYFVQADNGDLPVNTVADRLQELNIYDAVDFRALEAGDYIGVQAARVAALPTENTDILLLGVRIKYQQQ